MTDIKIPVPKKEPGKETKLYDVGDIVKKVSRKALLKKYGKKSLNKNNNSPYQVVEQIFLVEATVPDNSFTDNIQPKYYKCLDIESGLHTNESLNDWGNPESDIVWTYHIKLA